MSNDTYSLCFMCSARCPIRVTTKEGLVTFIEGNPHVPGMEGSLCPIGAAGTALLYDDQRIKSPMIRIGERGSGHWKKVSWDDALKYVADKLKPVIDTYGGHSVAFAERTQTTNHVSRTFMQAIGSPNHFTHDALFKGSLNTACRSLFGYTDEEMGIDYKNTKNIIFYGRNIFEGISVREVRDLMSALENGARMTYIDPRVTVTATKAHRYWMIRPGTDLALNYALMHVILKEKLYDAAYVERWVTGIAELRKFIDRYTPRWAEDETGIPAQEIVELAREVARAKPSVVFHFGNRGAGHANEIYLRRSILMLNVLMGSIESPGGYYFRKGPEALGRKPARELVDQELPAVETARIDKVGSAGFPLPDPVHGAPQMIPGAILDEDPYPLKALFAYHFDPLFAIPDTTRTKKALEKLDLIVSIDVNWSDIAWHSDVILPESIYLERTDCVQQVNGLTPQIFLSKQAVPPRYDTREGAVILKEIAERIGVGRYFPYQSMEELVAWQMEGTGFAIEDFATRGFITYCKDAILWDRLEGIGFRTPSRMIEFKSSLLEEAGFPSFPEYEPVAAPPEGEVRLLTGRGALHTHLSTQNNPYLSEICPGNELWINETRARELGIRDGDQVQVTSRVGQCAVKARVTDLIHAEAVFMLHGFGHEAEKATRSYKKGANNSLLIENQSDMIGGSPAMHDTFVSIRPA